LIADTGDWLIGGAAVIGTVMLISASSKKKRKPRSKKFESKSAKYRRAAMRV
jgi:hypothetical protein